MAAVAVVGALGACSSGGSSDASYDQGIAYDDSFATEEWRDVPVDEQEEYDDSPEQPFQDVSTSPLSTFASDVDTASYSNLRRQLNQGVAPEGVRIEELVNYFDYDYPTPEPSAEDPFTVTTQIAESPWAPEHQLAMIGVQATAAKATQPWQQHRVPARRVRLDGRAEQAADARRLVRAAGRAARRGRHRLDRDLRRQRRRCSPTPCRATSAAAGARSCASLRAGGSTGGAQGLQTAYELAARNFVEGGNNRVILATDGDFNVGPSTPEQLTDLIEEHAKSGVYISVLGFGMGNLKDNTMEAIADHGNGNYAYIDTLDEARKVLVDEFDSTMFVVAQDLKVQVEFNPATVAEYRLLGYDNRRLEDEEFDDDTKDAGDVGAGHAVTAFYELVPARGESRRTTTWTTRTSSPGTPATS